ncbi:MAG TPA: AAA family ATPase [Bacteroidales bacterium]|nr:AAA family ATPase [Bacteroidales bacterium]
MSIRIKEINIDNLGPIKPGRYQFNNINLIYSKNEGGKSLLVEFILRSLFSKKSIWGYNREIGNGKIIVSGINDKSISYSPASKDKLDKYFEKKLNTFQTSLTKLLIIKSGETNINEGPQGIDVNTLKELLSSKNTLDKIDSKIQKTIQNANFTNNFINIDNTGEGKTYKDLKDTQLQKINQLINRLNDNKINEELKLKNEIEELKVKKENLLKAKKYKAYGLFIKKQDLENRLNDYPDYKLEELKKKLNDYAKFKENIDKLENDSKNISEEIKKLKNVRADYEKQLNAKRNKAYKLDNQIKEINLKLSKISDDDLNKLDNKIINYKEKLIDYQNNAKELETLEEKNKDFNWVKNIEKNYYDLKQNAYNQTVSITYLIIAAIVFISGLVVSIVSKNVIIGSVIMLLGFGFSIYFSFNLRKLLKNKAKNDELERLQNSFKEKFKNELDDAYLATLISELDVSKLIDRVKDEQTKLLNEINRLKAEIENQLFQIFSKNIDEADWLIELNNYKQERNKDNNTLNSLKLELAKLAVDVTDYYTNDIDEEYNSNKLLDLQNKLKDLDNLEKQLNNIELDLKNENDKLDKVKAEIRKVFDSLNIQIPENEWKDKLDDLINTTTKIKNDINAIAGELNGLGIDPENFIREDPGIKFDPTHLLNLENLINDKSNQLKELEKENLDYKGEIANITGLSTKDDWNTLIDQLYAKQNEILNQLKHQESFIIAGILVHQAISELLRAEDEHIQNSINSPNFSDLLFEITGKYKNLTIDDDGKILISSDTAEYKLQDLSTGTKEQVLFALRVTLAEKILDDKAFFILDDAFQHSDYDRRPKLIDQVFSLADRGWQIIYLTMDEHIRDVFTNKGVKREDYLMKEL